MPFSLVVRHWRDRYYPPMDLTKRKPAPTNKDVLAEIKEAAKLLGLKPSTLCLIAINNAHVPVRLKDGGSITLATVHRLRKFVDAELQRRSKNRANAA
jgi:hypothetical protein